MFKYPAPWQVLCSNLEKRGEQVSVNEEGGGQNLLHSELLIDNTNEQDVTDSSKFQVLISSEYQNSYSSEAPSHKHIEIEEIKVIVEPEAQTKSESKWQETDIHATKEEIYIPEEQQPNITDSENSTSPVSTMDRVTRSLIFSRPSGKSIDGSQENLMNSTTEDNQVSEKSRHVWDPKVDRQLKVLREEERFEIRSRRPENSPTKLFADSNGEDDEKAKMRSNKITPGKAWELENERRDIIRKQGQRKSLDTENLFDTRDEIGVSVSDIDLNGAGSGQNTTDVDTEQINFEAARQQFVMLEKKRKSLPITPRLYPRSFRQSSYSLNDSDDSLEFSKVKDTFRTEQDVKPQKDMSSVTQAMTEIEERPSLVRKQFFRELSVDSVDTEKEEKPSEIYREEPTQKLPEEEEIIPNPSDETPIEREIRLAMQREESLRKERGIQSLGETKEMIEILKNPVLSISSDSQLERRGKDRARTAFFLQREIEKEVQREADLKSEGKVAGLYDKGNAQELDERRKLFEQPDEIPVQPLKGTTKILSTDFTDNTKENIAQADLGQNSEIKNWQVRDAPQPYSVRANWKPKSLNTYRSRRLSADNILDLKIPTETLSEKEASEETFVLSKENFHVQPYKFSQHVQKDEGKDENDHKMERTRDSSSHGKPFNTRLKYSLSNVIEQEIQQTLERDRELQDQRRKTELPPVTIATGNQPTTPHNGPKQYGRQSLTSGVSSSWSPAPWRGTTGSMSSSNISPVQMFRPMSYPKFVDSESDEDRLRRRDNW
ncbi:mitotic interactor and substrate of PLK1 isoform X2 [Mixophyes fleayi]